MALWTVHGNGRHLGDEAVVGSGERLSWPLTIGFGMQHMLAMFGTTALVPALTGFPASTTFLFSGAGTLLFLLVTRNRVPGYLGASFGFAVPMAAAVDKGGAGPGALLGAIVIVGLVVVAVGIAVKALGVRLLESVLPPVVTGGIVLMLGMSVSGQAVAAFRAQPWPAVLTLVVVLLATVFSRGMLRRLAVLLGVLAGWGCAVLTGQVDQARWAAVAEADWFGLPQLQAPQMHLSAVPFLAPMVLVLVAELVGNVKAVAAMSGRNLDGHVGDALIGGGLANSLAGSAGGSALSSYAPNVGVMAAARVYSTAACVVAAGCALLMAFCPKLHALIGTIPQGVLGGAMFVVVGVLALVGVRIWSEAGVDFADPVNLAVLGTALVAGVGDLTVSLGALRITGLVWGSVGMVLVYPLLRGVADAVSARRGVSRI